jgi:acyl carrier protein
MKQRVLRIASDVLGAPIEQLDGSSSPDTVESWDSLNHMNLVLALEEEFEVQFSDDQIVELLSIDAMVDALSAMPGARDADAG